jgi:hypothetical protein
MTSQASPPTPPIVCDMTDAPDTATQRMAEYEQLFTESLIGRERTDTGVRFRLRAHPGLEDWVRDLAAREKACCAFFTFSVTVHGDEVWWDSSVVDDDIARRILDEFYRLPDTVTDGAAALRDRFADQGLQVMVDEASTLRPATTAELGSTSLGT